MRILINEGLQADAIDILKGFGYEIINQKYDYDALMDIIQTVDVLIVKSHLNHLYLYLSLLIHQKVLVALVMV